MNTIAVPNISPERPPGSGDVVMIVNWVAWLGVTAAIVGVIICAIMMVLAASGRHGGGGEHMSRLGWVLGGLILMGAAGTLVGVFI